MLGWQSFASDQRHKPEVDEDQHWMWAARLPRRSALAKADVLERPDGYMRRSTCLSCKAVNPKKLLPALVQKQVAFAMLLVAVHLSRLSPPPTSVNSED